MSLTVRRGEKIISVCIIKFVKITHTCSSTHTWTESCGECERVSLIYSEF